MKYILTILTALLLSAASFCQTIDSMVAVISKSQIDSFSNTLDSTLVIDTTTSSTFFIDTIKLRSGEFKMFSVSVTLIQTNGTTISRAQYLSYNAISNVVGSYYLKTTNAVPYSGIQGVAVTPQLLNNNTICVIKITINNRNTKIHYRRQEI